MGELRADAGSFRDPKGRVFHQDGRVLRLLSADGLEAWQAVLASGAVARLVKDDGLWPVGPLQDAPAGAPHWAVAAFEHPRLPLVSYPYEWSFGALKAAALRQLDLHLAALEADLTLSDATAFNLQFDGARAVFIDPLSLRPYNEGELWAGHRQFVAEFLAPLLLRAWRGVPHNAFFRGQMTGIDEATLAPLLPARAWFSGTALLHVLLPHLLQRRSRRVATDRLARVGTRHLPRRTFRTMLEGLRSRVAGLRPRGTGESTWSAYTDERLYSDAALREKADFVRTFVAELRPKLLIDLGCNSGEFSALALAAGAQRVVGLEADQGALDGAFRRAETEGLAFTPLLQDAMDPSPGQGFAGRERPGLAARLAGADALLALAVLHHLCIARNLPLDRALEWLVELAPHGIVEFVPKSDPTVRRMLALREDVFDGYDEAGCLDLLGRRTRIVEQRRLPDGGRLLVRYERG